MLLIALLAALWEISAARGWVVSDNWPRLSIVLLAGYRDLVSGELIAPMTSTLYGMLTGYIAGCILGVVFGVLMASYRLLDWTIRPLIEIQRTLPSPAIIPPFILILGVGDALKSFMVMLAVFTPVFMNTYEGHHSIDRTLLLTARTLRLGRFATLWKIVLPATLPAITAGMRIALSLALVVAVITEMVTGSSGIGRYLTVMQYAMRADAMYAALICVAALGYAGNLLFLVIERRVLYWSHDGGQSSEHPYPSLRA